MISSIIYQQLTSTGRLIRSSRNDQYRIWKAKIKFVLSELGVSYVLTDPIPAEPLEGCPKEEKERYEKWIKDDFTCRHTMLFAMEDPVFFEFEEYETAGKMMDNIDNLFFYV
ncbi:hypothetical protein Sjap_014173 [Stephania japonica]|uniref:Uncharacterized protein n=1 Tax=Stephania japonica TaxID=461633 RepID=A0AAP0P202_9MAGN